MHFFIEWELCLLIPQQIFLAKLYATPVQTAAKHKGPRDESEWHLSLQPVSHLCWVPHNLNRKQSLLYITSFSCHTAAQSFYQGVLCDAWILGKHESCNLNLMCALRNTGFRWETSVSLLWSFQTLIYLSESK